MRVPSAENAPASRGSMPSKVTPKPISLRRSFLAIAAGWSVAVGILLWMDVDETQRRVLDLAHVEAQGRFQKYLVFLSPNYMTREFHEITQEQSGAREHITALEPTRAENPPDGWETAALQAFEAGEREQSIVETRNGETYLRYMAPLTMQPHCLKCHADQGRKVGEIYGGVSVSMPLQPHLSLLRAHLWSAILQFAALWAVGLLGLGMSARSLAKRVAENKQAAQAFIASEVRFRTIFDQVTDGMLLADSKTGALTLANRAMCELLGYSAEELIRMEIWDVVPEHARPRLREAFEKLMRGEPAITHDLAVERKDGTSLLADVSGTAITIDDRALFMGSFRDVTEKRALEARVAQADRLASMGMLAAGVAHEINNPLTYVLANVESLAQDLPTLTEATRRCCSALRDRVGEAAFAALAGNGAELLEPAMLDDVVARANDAYSGTLRIKAVSRGLGTFSRVERVERSEVDLRIAIDSAASLVFNELKYRATLVRNFGEVPAVWASESKLSQVFLNLLINASHAIDEGDVDGNRIEIRTWAEGNDVFVELKDTGKGIPAEILPHIFEPFFTTKKVGAGSGLGLAICKNIVTELGGDLRVESQVGKGTRVVVRLPVGPAARERPQVARGAEPSRAPSVRGRILVVDDEEGIRSSITRLLGGEHEVITATTGGEGKALLERDRSFDLILCDVMMPQVSGMDLHQWLLTRDPALAKRVVFITGGAFTPRASTYLASVDNPKLEKPFDGPGLQQLVSELLLGAKTNR
jgi:two-component system cell cycle sensor histidine kinase/response regulator CckA